MAQQRETTMEEYLRMHGLGPQPPPARPYESPAPGTLGRLAGSMPLRGRALPVQYGDLAPALEQSPALLGLLRALRGE